MCNFLEEVKSKTKDRIKNIRIESSQTLKKSKRPKFENIFKENTNTVIAEIKFSTPSKGNIYSGELNHVQLAEQYIANGAAALSVLTEPYFFKGNIAFIADISRKFPDVPILLKDFVLSEIQIQQAVEAGASAVLLIVDFLSEAELMSLYNYSLEAEITPVVEVSGPEHFMLLKKIKPDLLLVNNRNLKTQEVNLASSALLIEEIGTKLKNTKHIISASGISTAGEIIKLSQLGYKGFLMGTALMTHKNPGEALADILKEVEKQ